ncbi:MAG: peptidylprolyl isomerase [Candidatus Aminicenantales bacterium]|jgi:peptidylprolyl isomerase
MLRIRSVRPCLLFLAASVLFLAACAKPKYAEGLYAEVMTNKGLIVLQLEFEKTPMTVANYVGLAEGTIDNAAFPPGRPYFDGTKWHRVVAGHVIQCGIPKSDKTGADGGPGYEFPNEIVLPDLNHGRAGMVNMANGGPHTNGSQWCITLGDRSYLDGDYTVFGHAVEGMDVVFKIAQGDEVQNVKIVRVGRAAKAFRPTPASFRAMVEAAKVSLADAEARKKAEEGAAVQKNWPNAIALENGLRYIVLREGHGQPPVNGQKLTVAYSGKCLLSGKAFVSTAEEGKPYWGEKPEPFAYAIGKTTINPGVDAIVTQMKKGEKRLVIVPAALGYRTGGFYARQRPNEKRFVISPNTLLVYEVELIDIAK